MELNQACYYYYYFGILMLMLPWTQTLFCPSGAGHDFYPPCQLCQEFHSCTRGVNRICSSGCHIGWKPPYCNTSYLLLRNPPSKISQSASQVTIYWKKWNRNHDYGEGEPKAYQVQTKTSSEDYWTPIVKPIPADQWSEQNDGFQITFSLIPAEQHSVRVLVVDADGVARETCAPVLFLHPENAINNKEKPEVICEAILEGDKCHEGCGQCLQEEDEHSNSSICANGCRNGWKGHYCNISRPVLWNPPVLFRKTIDEVTVFWKKWNRVIDIGDGSPIYYQVQTKAISEGSPWQTVNEKVPEAAAVNSSFAISFPWKSETELEVRVLVIDSDGIAREDCVPSVRMNATEVYLTYKNLFKDAGVWIGCLAAGGLLVAVGIVIAIECKQRNKSRLVRAQESRLDLINNGTLSNRNTLRPDTDTIRSAHVRTLAAEPQGNATRVSDRLSAFFQNGARSWFPVDNRNQRDSTGSWYTEWYGSRKLYDNPVMYQVGDDIDEISFGRSGSVDSSASAPAVGPTYVNTIQKTFHNNLRPV